jgi:hypothetical protein
VSRQLAASSPHADDTQRSPPPKVQGLGYMSHHKAWHSKHDCSKNVKMSKIFSILLPWKSMLHCPLLNMATSAPPCKPLSPVNNDWLLFLWNCQGCHDHQCFKTFFSSVKLKAQPNATVPISCPRTKNEAAGLRKREICLASH